MQPVLAAALLLLVALATHRFGRQFGLAVEERAIVFGHPLNKLSELLKNLRKMRPRVAASEEASLATAPGSLLTLAPPVPKGRIRPRPRPALRGGRPTLHPSETPLPMKV